MPATTDTLAPGYAWVPPALAATRAADAQDAIDARHAAAADRIMLASEWLATIWDVNPMGSDAEDATRAEAIAAALAAALAPFRGCAAMTRPHDDEDAQAEAAEARAHWANSPEQLALAEKAIAIAEALA